MPRSRQRLLTLALAAIAFLPMLGDRDVITSHEARVVQTARAMAASGWPWAAQTVDVAPVKLFNRPGEALDLRADPDAPTFPVNPWLVPILNGEIRLQKPPLPYWCSAILFKAFGGEAGWSAALSRLAPALLGFLATFLIADLARRTIGRRAALPAALVWASLHFASDEFRKSMADPYLAFFTLATLWAWVRATAPDRSAIRNPQSEITHHPTITPSRHPSTAFILVSYVSLGLGLIAKGPPIFITLLPPLIVYHVLYRKRGARFPRPWLAHVAGVVLCLAIAAPWTWYVFKTVPHAWDIWRFESIGEVTGENTNNVRPAFYYGPILFEVALPWTPIWIAALVLPFARRKRTNTVGTAAQSAIRDPKSEIPTPHRTITPPPHHSLFPTLAYLIPVLLFSFVHLKKKAYLLPAAPMMALMVASALVTLMAGARRFGTKSFASFILAGQALIPLAFAIALPVIVWKEKLPVAPALLAIVPAAMAAVALFSARLYLPLTAGACGLVIAVFSLAYNGPGDNRRSPRPAAAALRAALAADPRAAVAPDALPPEATCYLPLDLPTIAERPTAPTLYHLVDSRDRDRKRPEPDRTPASFANAYPLLKIREVEAIPIEGEGRPRYRLFRLTLDATPRKVLAE